MEAVFSVQHQSSESKKVGRVDTYFFYRYTKTRAYHSITTSRPQERSVVPRSRDGKERLAKGQVFGNGG